MKEKISWFKRKQGNKWHYYEVHGEPGRTATGHQQVINFLNDTPIISIEHNDLKNLTGTWDIWETGTPITKEEYQEAWNKAFNHPNVIIK